MKQPLRLPLTAFALLAAFSLRAADECETPVPVPQSPNAASFGEYGKTGFNGFLGTPGISVPLFELELCGKKFPVTLSYNASGVKVAQEASWVGLGWNLNLGGCITRQVKGGDDFATEDQTVPYTRQSLSDSLPGSPKADPYLYSQSVYHSQAKSPTIFHYDTEPDEFYFNFAGHTGAFFFEAGCQEKDNDALRPHIVE